MKNTCIAILIVLFGLQCFSQGSDFIVLKKNQRTIKTIYAGSMISFATASGSFSGRIEAINRDSIFFLQYDVRQVATNLGVYVLDTVSIYKLGFRYTDIAYIGEKHNGFNWATTGGSLFGGGILLTTVGLGTWLFTKSGTQYYASPNLIIGAAALGALGYLILKSNNSFRIGSKYHFDYISTQKKPK